MLDPGFEPVLSLPEGATDQSSIFLFSLLTHNIQLIYKPYYIANNTLMGYIRNYYCMLPLLSNVSSNAPRSDIFIELNYQE